MASSVEIANSALTKLGELRIMSLDDNVKAAREINAIFTLRRDALLRAYNWNFAMKRANLPALSDAPANGYAYAYQLPSDCLRMIQVGDYYSIPGLANFIGGIDDQPYKIEGQTIVTDLGAPLAVRYLRRVTNSGEFDVMFNEVLAYDLAFETCESLTQNTSKKESLRAGRHEQILLAVRANAIELPPESIPDDSWIASRF